MPARALIIEVRLLAGRYHGVGDWPPAPFRLFQALVAGAYGGRWRAEPKAEKDAAFRWLENLSPPYTVAPSKIDARATTYFVPNNDIDAVDGDPRRVSEIRSGKLVRPILLTSDTPFVYVWAFDDGEKHASHICDFASRLHTLGYGIDPAFARAEVCDWGEAESRLAAHPGALSCPGKPGDPKSDPLCPIRGSLDSLKARHAAGSVRFRQQREGRITITRFKQPPKALARAIAYDRPPARLLFDLRSPQDDTAFLPMPQEQASTLVTAIRDLASRRLTAMLPKRAAEVERLVVGRDAGAADIGRRVRIIALPTIGHLHASPSIRRVLVEIPPDCPFSRNDLSVALASQSLDRVDEITGEVTEGSVLTPATDDSMLWHYGIGGQTFRRWQTITPAALSEARLKGRVRGGDRAAAEQRAAAAVADALRHAGKDWRGVAVRVQAEPFRRQGARADAFDPDRFGGKLRHAEITFPAPVSGPMVIGDGRWLGLGLMAPVREEPPAVHLFSINSAEAPAIAAREALTRALRNAVMARVDEEWRGNRRGRRNEPLPLFFTGHEPDGKAARSGRHQHLFFLADDTDGDGKIDRLAVVAPHLADRTVVYNPDQRSDMRDHLHVLERALNDFTKLRAGRAGAPPLTRVSEPDGNDPLFGRTRTWVSRTSYHPTRHPKGSDVEAAAADDLANECVRRGLPRPKVEIIQSKIGRRGGLAIRARLHFKIAIFGPLLLGRGSHFGAGLFLRGDMDKNISRMAAG